MAPRLSCRVWGCSRSPWTKRCRGGWHLEVQEVCPNGVRAKWGWRQGSHSLLYSCPRMGPRKSLPPITHLLLLELGKLVPKPVSVPREHSDVTEERCSQDQGRGEGSLRLPVSCPCWHSPRPLLALSLAPRGRPPTGTQAVSPTTRPTPTRVRLVKLSSAH